MHANSLCEQDFGEIVIVLAGQEPFVFNPELGGFLVLQHAQREAADDAEVRIGVSFSDTAVVFPERHVELPVEIVFDTPMRTHRPGKPLG